MFLNKMPKSDIIKRTNISESSAKICFQRFLCFEAPKFVARGKTKARAFGASAPRSLLSQDARPQKLTWLLLRSVAT